jgi:atlastin
MSDTDSLVLVDTNPEDVLTMEPDLIVDDDAAHMPGSALQIVSIDADGDHAFQFHKEQLDLILSKIPLRSKVAVISVVGAFRTGKSFLLSWFLRYLNSRKTHTHPTAPDGSIVPDDDDSKWYDRFQAVGNDGFDWRAGSERNTTGIWMWSEPHFTTNGNDDEPLAILLVDTQGMFDHDTNMGLTAAIFGFSTLLSSFQIYNVDKRIQEDNLQHLALFSEYARTAVTQEEKQQQMNDDSDSQKKKSNTSEGRDAESSDAAPVVKPFQHIEFLVRDWQHFEQDDEDDKDYAAMEKSMETYLDSVLSEREDKDLKDTRDQITSCFNEISCYGLVHPGFAATKKKFTGNVKDMEQDFVGLLDRYCGRVFDRAVQPKVIRGRELTAMELGPYIEAYAAMFTSGASFPEAATMLEATAAANNTNAVHLAQAKYKELMDRVAGPVCTTFLKQEELDEEHRLALRDSLEVC